LALVSEITARDLRNRTRRTENWSPAARLLAGAAGSALAVYGGTLGAGLGRLPADAPQRPEVERLLAAIAAGGRLDLIS
jgi:hypothetical protein